MLTNTRAIDPVCGMEIEVNDSTLKASYKGKEYYFCSPACVKSFEKDPQKYLPTDEISGEKDQHDHHYENGDKHDHHCENGDKHDHHCENGNHHHHHH